MPKSDGRTDTQNLAKQISRMSSLSSADTSGMLEAFLTVVPDELADGRIVELGEFGTFRVSFSSAGSDSPEAVTAANITDARVIFTPGKRFKKVLDTLEYQKEAAAQVQQPAQ
jgi:predicted histone-like DNA-binding protein